MDLVSLGLLTECAEPEPFPATRLSLLPLCSRAPAQLLLLLPPIQPEHSLSRVLRLLVSADAPNGVTVLRRMGEHLC